MPRRAGLFVPLLLVFVGAAVGIAGYTLYRVRFAQSPTISLEKPFEHVGLHTHLNLRILDLEHGVSMVRVTLTQGNATHPVFLQAFRPARPTVSVDWSPAGEGRFTVAEGAGRLHVEAKGAPWLLLEGRKSALDVDFTAILKPPRVEELSSQHRVHQGGCEVSVYRVEPPEGESGVIVGSHVFPGYELPGGASPSVRFALFAFPYDSPVKTPIRLRALDVASNQTLTPLVVKVVPRAVREKQIILDDAFIQRVNTEILSHTPSIKDLGDPLKTFLKINGDLRRENNAFLGELAKRSVPRFLWTEPFRQLSNSQVEAHFADHRSYHYKGAVVDRQAHLGYDLAATAHAPVIAANDGTVLFADFLGIYGNTIVIDHGYGLLSVYGHLSSMEVASGASVKRGQSLGRSGQTGLAAGDHLHYSMILQGVQIDPKEWWDPHWIHDRITSRLSETPVPASPAPAPRRRRTHKT